MNRIVVMDESGILADCRFKEVCDADDFCIHADYRDVKIFIWCLPCHSERMIEFLMNNPMMGAFSLIVKPCLWT
jgi:hypothetical protein